jgi:hypothetical protein
MMHPVLQTALDHGFTFTVLKKDGNTVFRFENFYKSGTADLVPVDGNDPFNPPNGFVAHTRYNKEEEIQVWRDLVWLNYYWWLDSKERSDGWSNPDPKWAEEMVAHGIVKKRVETVTIYE